MEPLSATFYDYVLLLGVCSALKLTVPSHTIHGIEGQPLQLSVGYHFNVTVSDIQIIWMFERPSTRTISLLMSRNQTVVSDFEYQHKFTFTPPNASLLIKSLHFSDEGNYTVKINIAGNGRISATENIHVTVDVPVTKPLVYTEPAAGVVEYKGNITLKCTVRNGTRVIFQWMKNGNSIEASINYSLSANRDTLSIVPVVKEAIGNYSCLANNFVSAMQSDVIMPTIYYGPYGLTVNSEKGQKIGKVFTFAKGEAVQFYCSADSNPPNNYSWIRKSDNSTQVITQGSYLEVASEKETQKAEEYRCSVYNSMTGKRDETGVFVVIIPIGSAKMTQKGKYLSPLAIITGISVFLIVSMCLLILWKRFLPCKAIEQKMQSRSETNYRKAQIISGHENALDDFGIYEFVAFPDPTGASRVSSQSDSGSNGQFQDFHGTVYEIIGQIPVQHNDQQHCT
ncbi:HEPACAM family member 2 [Heteronotia binoei]|uniref:HEPACAM family member 2 n=1 Tax=Heteronotia binoei TaxID=13085 RepID=UPI00293018EB|nr:HEPACAM family member 2 [Heteronotia binoei]